MQDKDTPKTSGKPRKPAANTREERLKNALKANMARRKSQARSRAEQPAESGDNNNIADE